MLCLITVLATERYSKTSCGVKGRDRSKLILGVAVSFGILALLAFGLRITSKLTSSTGMLSVDDYVMIIAVVSFSPRLMIDIMLIKFSVLLFLSVSHLFRVGLPDHPNPSWSANGRSYPSWTWQRYLERIVRRYRICCSRKFQPQFSFTFKF